MNGRLRGDYEVAQQHTYGHDYPIVGKLAYEFAQHITYRHKANVGSCKEEYQTKVGICKTYADSYYLRKAKAAAGYLKNGKYADYRQEGFGHFLKVARGRRRKRASTAQENWLCPALLRENTRRPPN